MVFGEPSFGFNTTQQPALIAAMQLYKERRNGKFHADKIRATPSGS